MKKINIGLIGCGVVGCGVVKFLKSKRSLFKEKYKVDFQLKTACDLKIHPNTRKLLKTVKITKDYNDIVNDPNIDVVVELIGGLHPAKEIAIKTLKSNKNFVTANKALISNFGLELFKIAKENNQQLLFESAVGAGVPVIKTITEGIVGNDFDGVYGIVNGTCNFILSEMSKNSISFDEAVEQAQKLGYAESDPTLDTNGMDSAHKLGILAYLAFGKNIDVKDIYTEGINDISKDDMEYAETLGLTIKLLAIAKKSKNEIEARVHPTLISKDHPLASINSIYNAVYLNADPLGDILLSGEGAGQMAAASGIISDLINLATSGENATLKENIFIENKSLKLKKIDNIETKFYLRFMANDKPGVLSKITGILGKCGIGINSVTQKAHGKASKIPVIMLTENTTEKSLRKALNQIHKLPTIKAKPVAIRMEKL
jgi:homoserine dehydrogenase